ncbi:unnamed protein product [Cuscuta campestris]|uniref:Treslin N-terminal domain-containing protein n=1 Tax=Cuscuta campestris TaxID=132261 RepID=A0A484KNK9_9ASTE|nr:unnamed protein product [Cuscuta campestris]
MADYSKTQRIVLLIDLHPLQTFQNPNSYLTSISATAKRLTAFASVTESLFSFRFFFSSLCPYLSTSVVDNLIGSPFLTSFNLPSETLKSLTTILTSMSIPAELVVNHSRASYVASSLYQLVLDCTWESENDDLTGKANVELPKISSNLVLLFSHLPKSISSLSEYMDLGGDSENSKVLDGFAVKFRELFGIVSNAFANKDIHLSWIDVRDGLVGCANNLKVNDFEGSMLLEDEIKRYGWGFCSTDSIVLDSALVPFGLIYPKIGISLQFLKCADSSKGCFGQLYLQILDVKGNPLQCRCCDLEFMNLSEPQSDECSGESIWCSFGEAGVIKMEIHEIQRYDEGKRVEDFTSSSILVRECFGVSKKRKSQIADDFLAYRVLDMLSGEMGENTKRNSVPIWNILMSFLYEEGYQAMVSLSSNNGQISGVLKPLTTHLALLSVIDSNEEHGWNQSQSTCARDRICNASVVDTEYVNGSLPEASTSNNCESLRLERRRKHKKSSDQNLCWNSFCDAAYECSDFNMVEVCSARKPEKSKMLKFFKCWMKQIKKHSSSSNFLQTTLHPPCSQQQHLPPPLFSQENLMHEGDASFSFPETAEVFFCNLPQWIEHRLRSGADLQSFAERLVKLSIHVLSQKYETDNTAADHNAKQSSDISHTNITTELMELLLQKPRDMKDKLEFDNSTSEVSDFSSTSKFIAREYELQVFLRMEILRSDVSESIRRSAKQKLVKQICSLLEIIQYLVEGGIHGHVCLYEYVERTIRIRYSQILKDIVTKIYAEMDLLPFGEEDEIQAHLFNSEDSDQSWKDKLDGSKMAKSYNILQNHSSQPADGDESLEAFREDEHARRLNKAREKRDLARRSVCPRPLVQQRVWAPRQQPKVPKGKFEQQKDTQRKDTQKACRYSVVCETPMSQRKHIYSPSCEKGHIDSRNSSSFASKALFQDP